MVPNHPKSIPPRRPPSRGLHGHSQSGWAVPGRTVRRWPEVARFRMNGGRMAAWSPGPDGWVHFKVGRLLEADRADRAGQLEGGRWFGTVRGGSWFDWEDGDWLVGGVSSLSEMLCIFDAAGWPGPIHSVQMAGCSEGPRHQDIDRAWLPRCRGDHAGRPAVCSQGIIPCEFRGPCRCQQHFFMGDNSRVRGT
jgi:hypothetical protein